MYLTLIKHTSSMSMHYLASMGLSIGKCVCFENFFCSYYEVYERFFCGHLYDSIGRPYLPFS